MYWNELALRALPSFNSGTSTKARPGATPNSKQNRNVLCFQTLKLLGYPSYCGFGAPAGILIALIFTCGKASGQKASSFRNARNEPKKSFRISEALRKLRTEST